MKTEQEQIEEIVKIILESSKKCLDTDCDCCVDQYEKDCNQYRKALALVQAGYGDVSEYKNRFEVADKVLTETREKLTKAEHDRDRYKAEIERLKEENKRAAISYTEYVLEEDTRFSVLRDNVAKLEQKNKRLCEENIEQYKKLKKQERKTVKQVQIDVLNKVKERAVGLAAIETYHICNLIDELIAEVENGKCNC